MKKSLLLSVALMGSVCAFAQEGTDITPANYKIQNEGVKLPFYQMTESQVTPLLTNINIGIPTWATIGNASEQYNDGLVLIGSGGGMTFPQWQAWMDSWNYIDFGGEIGRTVGFITTNCDIQAVLNDWAPGRNEEWENLNVNTGDYGGGAINFFLDPNNTPTTGFIRAKFVVNIYHNTMDGGNFIANFNPMGDQNNATTKWGDDSQVQNPMPGSALTNDACMDENTGEWDPTRWAVVEVDFTVPAEADGIKYTPYRIKMFLQGSKATQNGAMFFKEISFTHYDSGIPEYWKSANISYITLEQDLANAGGGNVEPDDPNAGVGSVGAEVNAPVEYFNLQGVKVVNPEKGVFIKKEGNKTSKVVL